MYRLLKSDRLTWYEAAAIALELKVSKRTVQRCLSRLADGIVERQETRPAPCFRFAIKGTRSAQAYANRLDAAIEAYGIGKEARTG